MYTRDNCSNSLKTNSTCRFPYDPSLSPPTQPHSPQTISPRTMTLGKVLFKQLPSVNSQPKRLPLRQFKPTFNLTLTHSPQGIFQGGVNLGGHYLDWELSVWELSRGGCPKGNCLGGIVPSPQWALLAYNPELK